MPTKLTHNIASNYPRFANMRVPNLSYHSDVDNELTYRCDYGVTPATAIDSIIKFGPISTGATRSSSGILPHRNIMTPFGRGIVVTCTVGGALNITIFGLDYLGQPISEDMAINGANQIQSKKMFKEVTAYSSPAYANAGLVIGGNNTLGLPFATTNIQEEYADQVLVTGGTKVYANQTPQTATSTDPRGSYSPSNIPNGVRRHVIIGRALEGELHGFAHFSA